MIPEIDTGKTALKVPENVQIIGKMASKFNSHVTVGLERGICFDLKLAQTLRRVVGICKWWIIGVGPGRSIAVGISVVVAKQIFTFRFLVFGNLQWLINPGIKML